MIRYCYFYPLVVVLSAGVPVTTSTLPAQIDVWKGCPREFV
ncbi:MAG: hypothetical protein ACRDPA_18710 [Solirubrobacteraceae bacterium]